MPDMRSIFQPPNDSAAKRPRLRRASRAVIPPALCLLLCSAGLAQADTTTVFPTEDDEFDYYIYTLPISDPKPYMSVLGDTVRGVRTTDDNTVVAVSYDLRANNEFTFCEEIYVEFRVDGELVDTLEMEPLNTDQSLTGSNVDIADVNADSHTLELIRISPFDDECGSIQWDPGAGWVTLHTLAGPNDDDQDGYDTTVDCNDLDADIHPDAEELCDDTDQDCDSFVDEGALETWYRDVDEDGIGNQIQQTVACEQPEGYAAEFGDCNNNDNTVYPDAEELCDNKDNDCDLEVDEGVSIPTFYLDFDGDGYGDPSEEAHSCVAPEGYVTGDDDCDDTRANVNPAATEICNTQDDDCDEDIDEGTLTTWYLDSDDDGYGDANDSTTACDAPANHVASDSDCDDDNSQAYPGGEEICGDDIDQDCSGQDLSCDTLDADGDGYSPNQGDCDDTNAAINPGATDVPYDGLDQDCSGADLSDVDGDGFDGGSGGSDCNDTDAAINPDAEERCNGVDDNCDDAIDDRDADEDGFVAAACSGADCDDTRALINPDAEELTDDLDNDCDGAVDEHLVPPTPTPQPTPSPTTMDATPTQAPATLPAHTATPGFGTPPEATLTLTPEPTQATPTAVNTASPGMTAGPTATEATQTTDDPSPTGTDANATPTAGGVTPTDRETPTEAGAQTSPAQSPTQAEPGGGCEGCNQGSRGDGASWAAVLFAAVFGARRRLRRSAD